jgi:hypothetical protein
VDAPTYIERDCMLSNLLDILYDFHKFKVNSGVSKVRVVC